MRYIHFLLNQELFKAGYAWWYRKYSDDQVLRVLEQRARDTSKGLWSDPSPMPPWEWRKYAPEDKVRKQYEREATEAKHGLWV